MADWHMWEEKMGVVPVPDKQEAKNRLACWVHAIGKIQPESRSGAENTGHDENQDSIVVIIPMTS